MNRRIMGSAAARGMAAALGAGLLAGAAPAPAISTPAPPAAVAGLSGPVMCCAALRSRAIPAARIGLPTGGGTVMDAVAVAADPATGKPAFCRVRGTIAAVRAGDPPILFQFNLPDRWNAKAVQFGGGGFNGVVVAAEGAVANGPDGASTPLARGFATYGGDSGHATPGADFVLNAQAFANYSGESVKRTHDAAAAIIADYYGGPSRRTYFIGGSKGGQEALVAAQRYPADFDGVVSFYPANQSVAMTLSWFRSWEAVYRRPGAWLDPARQALLRRRVLAACDALDGATDGLIGNLRGCGATFSLRSLRCPAGRDAGDTCLSDAQIAALEIARGPMRFAFPLAHGVTGIGPYPVLLGGDVEGHLYDADGTGTATSYHALTDPGIRVTFQQNPHASTVGFDYRAWRTRIATVSLAFDATDPNLDRFRARGGKLLIVQGTTDMLVPAAATSAYVDALRARYGQRLAGFARYYLQPGFGHGNGAFALRWDSLAALDRWVERQVAPSGQIATDAAATTRGRTRPLCDYPAWPRYTGSGAIDDAASFRCVTRN